MRCLILRRAAALSLALVLAVSGAFARQTAVHILLIGVDSMNSMENARSDTMLLIRADPAAGDIRMVSFLRDLFVDIPGIGRGRLNASYFHGGEKLLVETIENSFGVPIDHTVTVHFSMLADLVDQLGGIELEITEKELPALNSIIEEYNSAGGLSGGRVDRAGRQRLNGKQALCYSRIRKIDSDFQRTSRQQAVIAAMLKQAGQLNGWQLLNLALANLYKVQTDMLLTDIVALFPLLGEINTLEMKNTRVPFEGTYTDETINGMMVLLPDLAQNRAGLQAFLQTETAGNASDD